MDHQLLVVFIAPVRYRLLLTRQPIESGFLDNWPTWR